MMDEQRVEVYFDSIRPDYPEYLNALEKDETKSNDSSDYYGSIDNDR